MFESTGASQTATVVGMASAEEQQLDAQLQIGALEMAELLKDTCTALPSTFEAFPKGTWAENGGCTCGTPGIYTVPSMSSQSSRFPIRHAMRDHAGDPCLDSGSASMECSRPTARETCHDVGA